MRRRWKDPLTALFWLLIAASLVPIWAFTYFPSQDGPSHLDNANILRTYPWGQIPVFREFYTINAHPFPNWTTHLLLAALMAVAPALTAEKLFLSAYVISLALAIRYCIHGLNPAASAGSLLAFPLIYNLPFQSGYYNFSMSLVMFFLCVGYWLRHREQLSHRHTAALAALFLILYFSHLVSTALACVTIGLLWAWFLFVELRPIARTESPQRSVVWSQAAKVAVRTFVAVLPAVLLALWYVRYEGTAPEERMHLRVKLLDIFTKAHAHKFRELLVWIPWEVGLLGLAAIVFFARHPPSGRKPTKQDGLLLVLAALFVLDLAMPNQIGRGGGIEMRLVLYLWLILMCWLATQSYSRIVSRAVTAFAVASALAFITMHLLIYGRVNHELKEYLSAEPLIRQGSTLLSIDLSAPRVLLPEMVHPFLHAAGYVAAQRNVVDFTNYEANEGYFPTLFLPEANPYTQLGDAEERPLELDLLGYTKKTGRSLDYVLLWDGNNPQTATQPDVAAVLSQLREGYEPTYVSRESGRVRLFRRK